MEDSVGSPSDFHQITARLKIPLAPVFLTKPSRTNNPVQDDPEPKPAASTQPCGDGPLEAVNQSLASLLMKYIPSLGSVLVSYLPPPIFVLQDQLGRPFRQVANKAQKLPLTTVPGNGWGIINVEVKLLGWRPTIGQRLVGRPTLSSPSHLSLVLYQTFNASIHENHLKSAGYYYDLNVQVPKSWKASGQNGRGTDSAADPTADEDREYGCWVDPNGQVVGGEDGTVSFTAISLTIANDMISVIGSLLDDPFSVDLMVPESQSTAKNAANATEANSSDGSSTDEDEPIRRISSRASRATKNRIESPPPVTSTSQSRRSRKNSEPSTDKPTKASKKRKLKQALPPSDDQLPSSPRSTTSTRVSKKPAPTPRKPRSSSVRAKRASTPQRKSKSK